MTYCILCIIFITVVVKTSTGHDNMTENGAICCGPKGEKGDYGHPGIRGLRVKGITKMHTLHFFCREV
jgi:hypothetical protein